jgi:hypothetical protein
MTLSRPLDRLFLGIGLIVLTLISPNISLPGSLPAIRLEQIALVFALIPFVRLHRREPGLRSLGIVDGGFLALALTTAATIVVVPIFVTGVSRSFRDVFELARIGEYWLVFRIGLTIVQPAAAGTWIARVLAVAAMAFGIVATIQYLNPSGFNGVVTAFWTEAHNLDGVIREGRAVGTAGNANQFGVLAVLLLLVALAAAIAREPTTTRLIWPCAIVGSVVSLVLAQSRGAILGAGISICVALGLLALRKSLVRGVTVTAPWIAAGLIAAIALAMVAPPSTGNILYRFNIAGILRDPSVVIRVAQAQSIFADSGNGPPAAGGDIAACVAELAPVSSPEPGHEPGQAAPSPAPTFDVDRLATAVAEYYCATGRWPSDIAHDIVPTYLHDSPGGSGLDAFSL